MNRYRTHHCGELRRSNVGERVRLSGWVHRVRDLGGLTFVDLRDHDGLTQILIEPTSPIAAEAKALKAETVASFAGEVRLRAEGGAVNENLPTGEIEVLAGELEILSTPEALPFPIASEATVTEPLRLQYRFLDLRRPSLHEAIVLRSQIIASMRKRMWERGFLEIQTPILTSSSPEGARDYLVPSRVHPGKFYALPQAPQQFKQLLMVSGFPRYFQIAPCFRDEDARADRSPGEFYQLDMEMAFVEQDDVFREVEGVLHGLFTEFTDWSVTEPPFPRVTFADAMLKYGTDKPDLRLPLELVDVTDIFADSNFRVFRSAVDEGGIVRALPVPGIASQSRKFFDTLVEYVREEGAGGMAWALFPSGEIPKGSLVKPLEPERLERLRERCGVEPGGGILFLAGPRKPTTKAAAALRVEVGRRLDLYEKDTFKFVWIVDFPMYERNEETGAIEFSHNPFSMPQGGMDALDEQDPLDVLAYQYDIVCNGTELSSGAIRNHRPDVMYRAFQIAGYPPEEVDERFGGMIRAFKTGAPPHGGLAPGVDRIVMLLAQRPNIREVIAFPMTAKAEDLMMGAPAPVSQKQLDELHLTIRPPSPKATKT